MTSGRYVSIEFSQCLYSFKNNAGKADRNIANCKNANSLMSTCDISKNERIILIFENFMTKFHELPEQPSYILHY